LSAVTLRGVRPEDLEGLAELHHAIWIETQWELVGLPPQARDLGWYRRVIEPTLDRTVVTVPNSEFSNLQIENFARRDRIWYHPAIHLRYETTPDQIRYILVEAHRMLYAHPKVDSASARIRFTGFDSSSLTLEVFSYVLVTDYGEYLEVAEDLNLRIMDTVAASGSSFALPSQTTYLEEGRGLDPDRTRAVEAQVKEWRERRELWLPHVPRDKIAEIENTLEYPPAGSATGAGGGRR